MQDGAAGQTEDQNKMFPVWLSGGRQLQQIKATLASAGSRSSEASKEDGFRGECEKRIFCVTWQESDLFIPSLHVSIMLSVVTCSRHMTQYQTHILRVCALMFCLRTSVALKVFYPPQLVFVPGEDNVSLSW